MHPSDFWKQNLEHADVNSWDEELDVSEEHNKVYEALCLEEYYKNNKKVPTCFIEKTFPVLIWSFIELLFKEIAIFSELYGSKEYLGEVTRHYDQHGAYIGKSLSRKRRCHCC